MVPGVVVSMGSPVGGIVGAGTGVVGAGTGVSGMVMGSIVGACVNTGVLLRVCR